ncbi:hypothetical protein D7Y53_14235 [Stenotrophomonas maltophilia]|nr:hypothetical protein [Stenotrophomonas maltophilia]PZP81898.1 MAG: hypothetical protein DI592_10410 [Stenotrophomonas maltophilia]
MQPTNLVGHDASIDATEAAHQHFGGLLEPVEQIGCQSNLLILVIAPGRDGRIIQQIVLGAINGRSVGSLRQRVWIFVAKPKALTQLSCCE